jgi:sugar (pentulose or hexulose) kinase
MTQPKKIAVLDIGKTNAKVVVLDCATGAEIAKSRISNRVIDGPPYPHYDVETLWSFILKALKGFAAEPGFDAISITTHGASLVLLDAEGNLALPVLDYEYQYPEHIRQAYAAIRPPFSESFSPVLPGGLNAGAQIHFQKESFPAEFARVRTILTYPQYWAYRLTGIAANEVTSLGCHTDLWRPREGTYSSLVGTLGIGELMAPVRSAFDALGPITLLIAEEIGLSKPVPVHCGIHDSNASLLAHLIGREPPFAVVSTGTWVVNFAVGGDLDHLDPASDTLANVDAYGRAVPSSRFMGGREFELFTSELGNLDQAPALEALPAVIDRQLFVFPSLSSGSGPYPRHKRQSMLNAQTSIPERWAAVCLYLALMTQTCLDLIGAKGMIMVEGPFARNEVYLKMLASLTQRQVTALPGSTGTSHGAAMLAGAAASESSSQTFVSPISIEGLQRYADAWRKEMEAADS